MTKLLSTLLVFLLVYTPVAHAQEAEERSSYQLSVPLLQGSPAPFTGLLISEADATQCIEDAAAVERLTVELAVRTRELELSNSLRDQFIAEQRARIDELSQRSWWDENGNIFMLGLGLVLGVAASALVVGLATN
jgi:hypothetical protein